MYIEFPQFVSWRVIFNENDPYSVFGKQTKKRIEKTKSLLDDYGYEFKIEEVDEQYLDKFVPLYEENIRSKKHGTVFPVRSRVLDGKKQGKEYKAVSLYKNNVSYLGGLIFSINNQTKFITTGYKVFPHVIPEKIPISVSFVAEVNFYTYALSLNFAHISHGTDRNVYGYNSGIGLTEYKLQVGCRPFFSKIRISTGGINEIFTEVPNSQEDMFIFLSNTPDSFIADALLISEKSDEELKLKFPILFSNKYFETTIVTHNELPLKKVI